MSSFWPDLPRIWQVAFEQSVESCLEGSWPIGAVVVDQAGEVVASGRNRLDADLLTHAETEALRKIPLDKRRECSLFTTLEPCPMCTGAIRVMKIKALHIGCLDPAGGSSDLLSANTFMRSVTCEVTEPINPVLASVIGAMQLEFRTRTGRQRWRKEWVSMYENSVEVGELLASEGANQRWREGSSTAAAIFDEVAGLVSKHT